MVISFKPLLALRTWFLVSFVVAWNVVLLVACSLNNWRRQLQGVSKWIAVAQLACTGLLAFAIVVVPSLREALTDPGRRRLYYSDEPFLFLTLVCGLLAAFFALAPAPPAPG